MGLFMEDDPAEEGMAYDGVVMRAGSGGTLAITISKPLVEAMRLKKGDKMEIWFVREESALYLVARKRRPTEAPSILKRIAQREP